MLVAFDGTNMPYPVLTGGPILPKTFYGEDPNSGELAEHKALMSLIEYLKETYGIEIHDISHSKFRACELKYSELMSSLGKFVDKFNVFLNKYVSCTTEFESILENASSKEHGQRFDEINYSVEDIVKASLTSIENIKGRLLNVGVENSGLYIGIPPKENDPSKVISSIMFTC